MHNFILWSFLVSIVGLEKQKYLHILNYPAFKAYFSHYLTIGTIFVKNILNPKPTVDVHYKAFPKHF
jgi:hypothetical protein